MYHAWVGRRQMMQLLQHMMHLFVSLLWLVSLILFPPFRICFWSYCFVIKIWFSRTSHWEFWNSNSIPQVIIKSQKENSDTRKQNFFRVSFHCETTFSPIIVIIHNNEKKFTSEKLHTLSSLTSLSPLFDDNIKSNDGSLFIRQIKVNHILQR